MHCPVTGECFPSQTTSMKCYLTRSCWPSSVGRSWVYIGACWFYGSRQGLHWSSFVWFWAHALYSLLVDERIKDHLLINRNNPVEPMSYNCYVIGDIHTAKWHRNTWRHYSKPRWSVCHFWHHHIYGQCCVTICILALLSVLAHAVYFYIDTGMVAKQAICMASTLIPFNFADRLTSSQKE